ELAEMAKHYLDFAGRNWALQQLGGVEDTSVTSARRFIVLNEHEAWLRKTALHQMAKDTGATTLAVVSSALRDPAPDVRDSALASLYRLDPKAGAAAADPMYQSDPNDPVRQTALAILAQARGKDALPLLVAASGPDNTAGMRYTAARQLGRLGGTAAEDALVKLTASVETRSLRGLALNALAATGDSARATSEALSHLGDYDPLFAVQAVYTAGRMGGVAGKAKLAEWRKTERRVTVNAAIDRVLARH
ncbi:MAG: HEAT repeat domain-containing protein, partial [Gemmatimonadales bacterium]